VATSWTGGHTLVALAAPEAAGPARVSCPGKEPEALRWERVRATIAVRDTPTGLEAGAGGKAEDGAARQWTRYQIKTGFGPRQEVLTVPGQLR